MTSPTTFIAVPLDDVVIAHTAWSWLIRGDVDQARRYLVRLDPDALDRVQAAAARMAALTEDVRIALTVEAVLTPDATAEAGR